MEKQSKLRSFIREEIQRLNEADEKGLNVGDIQRLTVMCGQLRSYREYI